MHDEGLQSVARCVITRTHVAAAVIRDTRYHVCRVSDVAEDIVSQKSTTDMLYLLPFHTFHPNDGRSGMSGGVACCVSCVVRS